MKLRKSQVIKRVSVYSCVSGYQEGQCLQMCIRLSRGSVSTAVYPANKRVSVYSCVSGYQESECLQLCIRLSRGTVSTDVYQVIKSVSAGLEIAVDTLAISRQIIVISGQN